MTSLEPLPVSPESILELAHDLGVETEGLMSALERLPNATPAARARIAYCARDVVDFAELFLEYHLLAQQEVQEDERWMTENWDLQQLDPERAHRELVEYLAAQWEARSLKVDACRRLELQYKSLFYFVRALQDALCLAVKLGFGDAPSYSSMSDALKKDTNAVATALKRDHPQYAPWFRRWKGRRDTIKVGTGFSLVGPGHDVGIAFNRIDNQTNGLVSNLNQENVFRLGDVLEALSQSTRLAAVARSIAVAGPLSSPIVVRPVDGF